MKKVICVLSLILLTANCAFATQYSDTLGKLEKVLYGFEYNGESETTRLDRIENTVYGNVSSGNTLQRLKKLKNDLSADLIGQEITPKEDTFAEDDNYYYEKEPVADTNIQYPAVDELENKVFKQKYPQKDIKQRLSDLEQKTFGKTYTNDDLATRTDRLKAQIKPDKFMNNAIAQSSNYFYDDGDSITLDKDYHLDRYESPVEFDYDSYNNSQNYDYNRSYNTFPRNKKTNLASIEKSVFNRSYKNDTTANRLKRLESSMFGTSFNEDDEQTRLNRLSSAYEAHKSSMKYDSNKMTRNMATALQIGTILLMVLACIL